MFGDLPLRTAAVRVEDDDYYHAEPALACIGRSSDDVPLEFRCAINGHLLKEPATPRAAATTKSTSNAGVVCPSGGADARRFDRRPRPARASCVAARQDAKSAANDDGTATGRPYDDVLPAGL